MGDLDYGHPSNVPAFFSDNLGSLSHVLASITEVGLTEEDRGSQTRQTIVPARSVRNNGLILRGPLHTADDRVGTPAKPSNPAGKPAPT